MSAGSNGIGMDNVISRVKLFSKNEDVMASSGEGEGMGTEVFLYLSDRKVPEQE